MLLRDLDKNIFPVTALLPFQNATIWGSQVSLPNHPDQWLSVDYGNQRPLPLNWAFHFVTQISYFSTASVLAIIAFNKAWIAFIGMIIASIALGGAYLCLAFFGVTILVVLEVFTDPFALNLEYVLLHNPRVMTMKRLRNVFLGLVCLSSLLIDLNPFFRAAYESYTDTSIHKY